MSFLVLEISEFHSFIKEGARWQRSAFLSSFFTLVGTHGFHIFVGLMWMTVALFRIWLRPLFGSQCFPRIPDGPFLAFFGYRMGLYIYRRLWNGASFVIKDNDMEQKPLALRIFGFVASLVLTVAAYFLIIHPELFHLGIRLAIMVILILAVLQAMVQFIFFLNVWREKGPPWNLGVFISTLCIILIIIVFSIWIMNTLDYNMIP